MIHSFFVFSACAEVVPRLTSAVVPGQSILRVRGGSSQGGVQVIEGLFVFSAHAEVVQSRGRRSILRARGGSSHHGVRNSLGSAVFSAHAEVVPVLGVVMGCGVGILRARGGSSGGEIALHCFPEYSSRTRR